MGEGEGGRTRPRPTREERETQRDGGLESR